MNPLNPDGTVALTLSSGPSTRCTPTSGTRGNRNGWISWWRSAWRRACIAGRWTRRARSIGPTSSEPSGTTWRTRRRPPMTACTSPDSPTTPCRDSRTTMGMTRSSASTTPRAPNSGPGSSERRGRTRCWRLPSTTPASTWWGRRTGASRSRRRREDWMRSSPSSRPNGRPMWLEQFGTRGADEAVSVVAAGTGLFVSGSTDGRLGPSRLGGTDAFVGSVQPRGRASVDPAVRVDGTDRAHGLASGSGTVLRRRFHRRGASREDLARWCRRVRPDVQHGGKQRLGPPVRLRRGRDDATSVWLYAGATYVDRLDRWSAPGSDIVRRLGCVLDETQRDVVSRVWIRQFGTDGIGRCRRRWRDGRGRLRGRIDDGARYRIRSCSERPTGSSADMSRKASSCGRSSSEPPTSTRCTGSPWDRELRT